MAPFYLRDGQTPYHATTIYLYLNASWILYVPLRAKIVKVSWIQKKDKNFLFFLKQFTID